MINTNDVNPMDWHNTKFLSYIPEHFVRVKFRHNEDRAKVLDWVERNTVGRFAIELKVDHEATSLWTIKEEYHIGFEDPSEATMYTMFFR